MAATATATTSYLCALHKKTPFLFAIDKKTPFLCPKNSTNRRSFNGGVKCMAIETASGFTETKKRSVYELQTLTGWLLRQEQAGVIDAELTIVISSISMACKQIASLVQRSGISNLTGVQGAVNVQGEDQKKLDVVSNEVRICCNSSYNSSIET